MTIDIERMKIHMPKEDLYYEEFNGLYCCAPDCNFRIDMPEITRGEDEGIQSYWDRQSEAELKTRQMFVDHQTGERYDYPCQTVVMGRPDQPDNSTWGMDKIACKLARGHDGKHVTRDGFEFGDGGFTNEERDAGRKAGDTDPCRMPGCLKVKDHLGDHFFRFSL